MKPLLFILMLFCFNQIHAQTTPYAIEDKRMDACLMQREPAELKIRILHLPDSAKHLKIRYTLVQLGAAFQADYFIQTDQYGLARILLTQNLPYQQVWLSVGNLLYTGLYVNSGLTVTIDARKLPKHGVFLYGKGITYSGKDGALNTVMSRNSLYRKTDKEALENFIRDLCNSRKKYTSDSFISKLDSVKQMLINIDNEFIKNNQPYARAIQNETLSDFYGQLCIAYWGDTMPQPLFKKIKEHQPFFTGNNGVLFYKYLCTYIGLANKANKLRVLDSIFNPQKSDILKLMLLETEKDAFAKSYPKISNSIHSKWCKKIADDEYRKARINQYRIDKLLAASTKIDNTTLGTPIFKLPFGAALYRIDAVKSVDEFFVNLKQTFPGKALVIDFWATWCAPCLSDLPESKALHESNKDLPIAYIYLCTSSGSSAARWQSKIADLEIPGTHIFMNEESIAKLKSLLNSSSGYPSYVSVNADGQVNSKAIKRMGSLNRESLKAATGLQTELKNRT